MVSISLSVTGLSTYMTPLSLASLNLAMSALQQHNTANNRDTQGKEEE
jgi:hypothetical protein